ncbi:YtxH domain-containing protein [Halpernia sp.]|uniref:YtxH domain-containing protein n=1 Tax=Halpernia sp. TaxID=2782209 RepID=UPI003A94A156
MGKGKGLLALLGLGALAFWKYKNSSKEDQQMVKDKINSAKDNLNKWGNDLKSKASEVMDQAKDKADQVQTNIENSAAEK